MSTTGTFSAHLPGGIGGANPNPSGPLASATSVISGMTRTPNRSPSMTPSTSSASLAATAAAAALQGNGFLRLACLPTAALGQTSHVTFSVRSLHCSPFSGGNGIVDDVYSLYAGNHGDGDDEGKQREDNLGLGKFSGFGSALQNNHFPWGNSSANIDSGDDKEIKGEKPQQPDDRMKHQQPIAEFRVTATLYGLGGLPLHSVTSSTRSAPLLSRNHNSSSSLTMKEPSSPPPMVVSTHCCTFDDPLSLPVRWKDLSRDSSIGFDVVGPGGRQVWGTTLPLFDENGQLHTGLQRLLLHPGKMADGGMKYDDSSDEKSTSLFSAGGVTPGLPQPSSERRDRNLSSGGSEVESNKDIDPIWEASMVLDQLTRLEMEASPSAFGSKNKDKMEVVADVAGGVVSARRGLVGRGGRGGGLTNRGGNDFVSHGTRPQLNSWLDALTKERCREILVESDAPIYRENDKSDVSPYSVLPKSWPDPSPSYLIVELPVFTIPVVHEEALYPHHLHGASGSVTPLDLSLYHKRLATFLARENRPKPSIPGGTAFVFPASGIDASDLSLSLVQVLDPENEDDNPVEDKYRTLAHDLLRGLVDPALKPDREQRARLAAIISSPSYHLTIEEQDLLWRFRFSLVDNRRALTKFLLAVDWTVESEVVQAAELLEQWRKRSPIAVTDALKLLGKNVSFQTSLVRAYAIDTLASAPDEELRLYLLQLVQALKYEDTNSVGANPSTGGVSSLALFLIERASKNIELANYLYWYLKVELQDDTHGARYSAVFSAFEEKLSMLPFGQDTMHTESQASSLVQNDLVTESKRGEKESSEQSAQNQCTTMWDILVAQDHFISGIMDCQMKSRDARGKKDAKEAHLRETLASQGFERIKSQLDVPLPSAPHILVKGVNPKSARMFKSALYPAVVEFYIADNNCRDSFKGAADKSGNIPVDKKSTATKSENKMKDSPLTGSNGGKMSTYKVMVKTGDDLRQDQLVVMMIQLMDGLLKRGTLDLCLRPYSIIAMSTSTGLVEFVSGSMPISQILASYNNSILQFFQKVARQDNAKYSVRPEVMQNYVRSCAGYCVITYILGVGDRHLDNIMLLPSGRFFHIDFGFIFGRDPKPLPPAFRLTREMVDGMGGIGSSEYQQFCSLACQAFNLLRKSAGLVLNLLHLMSDAGIEDLSNNPTADAEGVIAKVEERFRLDLTDEQAEFFFLGLINDSLSALAPRVMDVFHQLAVARR